MTLTQFVRTSVSALSALAFASALTPANAADLYGAGGGSLKDVPVIPPTWTGFYIGGHMGAAWSHIDLNRNVFDESAFVTPTDPTDPVVVFGRGNLDTTNAFGGVQLGYNFQYPGCCFVYGIEVDFGGLAGDNERSFLIPAPDVTGFVRFKREGGFYGDVTGRLGYTWNNNVLVYAKGGFAFLNADFKAEEAVVGAGGIVVFDGRHDNNDTLTGWTVGGGIEWMVSPNWSIKAEYLHFDFSNFDNDCCGDRVNVFRNHADLIADTVKLGFNYFVHAAPEPLPYK